MQRKSIWQFLKTTINEWVEAEPFELAAALSYYTLFSLAPLLLIAIGIAGFVFGREAAQNQIVETLQGMIGQDSAKTVQEMLQASNEKPKTGMLSTIIGFVALLFGAGGVVGQLQTSLNKMWEVTPKPGQGIWGFLRQRFFSFAMVLAIGFLLLVSLVVTAVLSSFTGVLSSVLGDATLIAHAVDILVSFGFVTLLFALIYKYVPDVEIEWRDVWVGAALTAILFTIGKYLIGLYIGTSGVSSTFGAAGSLITILVWVYYSSLIFFLGAEFTRVYATQYGSGVAPAENAQMDAAPQSANA
ncbi:MAG TPA: YihY/virulence factor BrkB family protein [Gammaproteobacteria bacterium]|nr:YihY/virulence factor BrkB family protein [Gammaproteobacteria bacterium]